MFGGSIRIVPVPVNPAEIVDLMTAVCSESTNLEVIETLGPVSVHVGFTSDTH